MVAITDGVQVVSSCGGTGVGPSTGCCTWPTCASSGFSKKKVCRLSAEQKGRYSALSSILTSPVNRHSYRPPGCGSSPKSENFKLSSGVARLMSLWSGSRISTRHWISPPGRSPPTVQARRGSSSIPKSVPSVGVSDFVSMNPPQPGSGSGGEAARGPKSSWMLGMNTRTPNSRPPSTSPSTAPPGSHLRGVSGRVPCRTRMIPTMTRKGSALRTTIGAPGRRRQLTSAFSAKPDVPTPDFVAVAVISSQRLTPLISTLHEPPTSARASPRKVLPSPKPVGSGSARKTSTRQPRQAKPLTSLSLARSMRSRLSSGNAFSIPSSPLL